LLFFNEHLHFVSSFPPLKAEFLNMDIALYCKINFFLASPFLFVLTPHSLFLRVYEEEAMTHP